MSQRDSDESDLILKYEEPTKTLEVYEIMDQGYVLVQSSLPGEEPILNESMDGYSLSQIYKELYPNQDVPENIAKATLVHEVEEEEISDMNSITRGSPPVGSAEWFIENHTGNSKSKVPVFRVNQTSPDGGKIQYSNCRKSYARVYVYQGYYITYKVRVAGKNYSTTKMYNGKGNADYVYYIKAYTGGRRKRRTHVHIIQNHHSDVWEYKGWGAWHWSASAF